MVHLRSMARVAPHKDGHPFIFGMAVTCATIIGYFGFARLSREWTLAISLGILVGLLLFFWFIGRRSRAARSRR